MIFRCQNPRECTAGNVFSEDPYRGGDTWTCHKCRYANQIPHYCRTCWNAKTNVQRDIDWLKPGDQVCTRGHRIEPVIDHDCVTSLLKGMSKEQLFAPYVQIDRGKSVPKELSSQVRGGFCHGACLDWIRRVLLHGRAGLPDKPLATQQTITAHLGSDANARVDASSRVLNASQAAFQKGVISSEGFYDIQKLPTFVRAWKVLAGEIDAEITDLRANNSKSPSKRPFSHLKVISGRNEQSFTGQGGGLKGLIDAVVKDGDFTQGRAAVLAVKPPNRPGASGHAIAVYKGNPDRFAFFDPNFGTYVFSRIALRALFVFLFKKAYPKLGTGSRDNKEYEINGTVVGEYAIFEKS